MTPPIRHASGANLLASLLSALALSLVVLVSAPGPAYASQALVASDPQPQAELERAPGWVNLAFDSPVDAGIAKVLVLNADGKNVTTGDLIVEYNTITTQLIDRLPRGTYTVQYRADDAGAPLGGSFQFSYGPGTFSKDAATTWEGTDAEPEVIKNPDPNATTTARAPQTTAPTEPPPVEPTESDPVPTQSDPEPAEPSTAPADSPAATDGGAAADSGNDAGSPPVWPWAVGGLVFILAMGGVTLWYLRTRTGSRP